MPTVLRYPYEAITAETDYLQLTIKRYPKDDLLASSTWGNPGNAVNVGRKKTAEFSNISPAQLAADGIILLPMPTNIQDRNQVAYGPDSLDPISAAAGDATLGTIGAIGGALGKLGTKTGEGKTYGFSDFQGDSAKGLQAVGKKLSDQSSGLLAAAQATVTRNLAAQAASLIPGVNVTGQQLLTRSTGQILNPNMELLFNAPALRSFSFNFKMTPRDEKEALQSKSIIRSLKRNMAPYTDQHKTFLESPNVFELEYRKGNSRHPFLHRFKQCALTDVSVNYTGENVYATYGDGTPVSMTMTLAFTELAPILRDDYEDNILVTNSEGQAVGYGKYSDSNSTVQKYEGVGY